MDFIEFCKENQIDTNAHYFFKMQPLVICRNPIVGGILCTLKSSDSPYFWIECAIKDGVYGKIQMVAIDRRFGTEKLYRDDFISLYNTNQIIKKVGENIHPETISWIEPLCGDSYIVHTQNVLIDENGKVIDEDFEKERNFK